MLADLSMAYSATLGKTSPFDSRPQSRQRQQKRKKVSLLFVVFKGESKSEENEKEYQIFGVLSMYQ